MKCLFGIGGKFFTDLYSNKRILLFEIIHSCIVLLLISMHELLNEVSDFHLCHFSNKLFAIKLAFIAPRKISLSEIVTGYFPLTTSRYFFELENSERLPYFPHNGLLFKFTLILRIECRILYCAPFKACSKDRNISCLIL